jgi:hypothetical protein
MLIFKPCATLFLFRDVHIGYFYLLIKDVAVEDAASISPLLLARTNLRGDLFSVVALFQRNISQKASLSCWLNKKYKTDVVDEQNNDNISNTSPRRTYMFLKKSSGANPDINEKIAFGASQKKVNNDIITKISELGIMAAVSTFCD